MRCPKCQYISFDSSERCRNCGYEFALAVDAKSLDLPIQTGEEAVGPFADFALSDPSSVPRSPDARLALDAESAPGPQPGSTTGSFDLPLFRDRNFDDAPLVTPAAVPRAPLAVRRSTPAAPAGGRGPARVEVEEPELDLELPAFAPEPERTAAPVPQAGVASGLAAPAGSRLLAAIIDAIILGAISTLVLYLTLRICGLTFSRIALIPPVPFVSFLLLIAGGYFTLFVAANGQTIGKMAAGLKVIPAETGAGRVSLGHAVLRAAAYAVSALPAGLGFLPALVGDDRRAIHDRLAATRVVKA